MDPKNTKILLVSKDADYDKKLTVLTKREQGHDLMKIIPNKTAFYDFFDSSEQDFPDVVFIVNDALHIKAKEMLMWLRETHPSINTVLLCDDYEEMLTSKMHLFMSDAYLLKGSSEKKHLRCLAQLSKKGFYYDSEFLRFMRDVHSTYQTVKLRKKINSVLTVRELQVIELICQQRTTFEISKILFLSPRTIEGHRNSLMLKTGAKNMVGLIVYAFQNKLVQFENLPPKKNL